MGVEAYITIALIGLLVGLLAFTRLAPDLVLIAGVTFLLVTGILAPEQALSGLANPGLVTVIVLYAVVAGVQRTGGVDLIARKLLGQPRSLPAAQARLMVPVMGMSAFLNNTPVVAMLIPAVREWAGRYGLSAAKLLLPLSYAAILGGTCTLIGTSTNLVVNGMLIAQTGSNGLGLFALAPVGIAISLGGFLYILLVSRWLLPDRGTKAQQWPDPRKYTVEMLVDPNSPLIGKSIEEAGLRHLSSMYLAELERRGQVLPAVSPRELLQANDRLVFVGVVESVVDLRRIRGLSPATDRSFNTATSSPNRILVEAVVSDSCPLVGKTIREGRFRTVYKAVVIAVARNGEHLHRKIGDIMLQPGDTLLLEARASFVRRQRNSRDFYLVSPVENSRPLRHDRAYLSLIILGAMVLTVSLGILSLLKASLLAAGLMIVTRCCTASEARNSINWQLFLIIAASFALGRALETTGAASAIATHLVQLGNGEAWLTLVLVYGITTLFTELITNNGAAVLVFPIAFAAANSLEVSFLPFVVAIMIASSASFATPIGYQTNLMVYGPGGYRFSDYLRFGTPLNLLVGAITVTLIPFFWPF